MATRAPKDAETLDDLILKYLSAIDTYQQLRKLLSDKFSAGFLSLAEANYFSSRGRYGGDFYDERMRALRGVEVVEREEEGRNAVVFGLKEIDGEKEGEGEASQDAGVRRRKGKKREGQGGEETAGAEAEAEGEREGEAVAKTEGVDVEPKVNVDVRDPIRWFGILVPPALRNAQSEFTEGLTFLPSLATTISNLSNLTAQISRLRATLSHSTYSKHLYKILPSPPPTPIPQSLPLSPLDKDSGYIHLCTASQVPGVVSRFMSEEEELWLLKIPYERIEKDVKWEAVTEGGEGGEEFPHLFSERLGVEEVTGVKVFIRGEGAWEHVWESVEWLEV
ncbi:hypothetical protein RUND412_009234 [Rhizina undulata]